jgi:hypothetical protein
MITTDHRYENRLNHGGNRHRDQGAVFTYGAEADEAW